MLKVTPDPTFEAEVKITVPGQHKPESVTMTFKYMPPKEYAAFAKKIEGKPYAKVLPEIVLGWDGPDQPFSKENLVALVGNYSQAGGEIFDVFVSNLMESRAKN